jgi:hypothetical protein
MRVSTSEVAKSSAGGWCACQLRTIWLAFGLVASVLAFCVSAKLTHQTRMVTRQDGLVLVVFMAFPLLGTWSEHAGAIAFGMWSSLVALMAFLTLGSAFWPLILVGCGVVAFRSPRPRLSHQSMTVIGAALLLALAMVTVTAYVVVPYGSGHYEDIHTAGQRINWFLGDVGRGRDPSIQGGEPIADPFGSAYQQMCTRLQHRVSEDLFRSSRGAAVSEALTASGASGSRHGDYQLVGVDAEHDDWDTRSQDIAATWQNVDLRWQPIGAGGLVLVDQTRLETWRVDLVREDGIWKVCELEKQ